MSEGKVFERSKSDYKNLESYLLKNDLIDDRRIWFAGFDNHRKATNNAIAGNLFYGNSRLIIVCIKDNDINYLRNSKSGFILRSLGMIGDKVKVSSSLHPVFPAVDINDKDGKFYSIKVTKNKKSIKDFKKVIKS